VSKRSLSEPIRQALDNLSTDLRVCIPGRVEKYDHAIQRAEVKPLVNRWYADGQAQEMPVIAGVPVVFPRSGGASLTLPVKSGDGVLLLFSDRSIDKWLKSGGIVTPDDRRKHSLSDCIAIPGLYSFADQSPAENNDDVLMQYDGSNVRLKPGGNAEIETSATIKAETVDLSAECETAELTASTSTEVTSPITTINGDVQINGSIIWTGTAAGESGSPAQFSNGIENEAGDIKSAGISLESHVHGGVEPGSGTSGGPQ
jgi:phage baseplate assembly protein V